MIYFWAKFEDKPIHQKEILEILSSSMDYISSKNHFFLNLENPSTSNQAYSFHHARQQNKQVDICMVHNRWMIDLHKIFIILCPLCLIHEFMLGLEVPCFRVFEGLEVPCFYRF